MFCCSGQYACHTFWNTHVELEVIYLSHQLMHNFHNIITSPLYVFRHSECHPQGVTVLKAQTIHRLYKMLHRYE